MWYLDTYIKPFVGPDIYSKYHALIERLEHRGPRSLKSEKNTGSS
jgi:hypothetical protein